MESSGSERPSHAKMSSRKQVAEKEQDHIRKSLFHYQSLSANPDETIVRVENGGINAAEILRQLSLMRDHVEGVGNHYSSQLPPKYYNEVRSNDLKIAEQVLSIPEILELILLDATVRSVVAMEQVSKTMRSIIKTSSKLQVKTGTLALSGCGNERLDYYTPFEDFQFNNGLTASAHGKDIGIEIFQHNEYGLPKFGWRWMEMLVCQPPLKTMNVQKYCDRGYYHAELEDVVNSDTGLTLADLYRKAEEMLAVPSNCTLCTRRQQTDPKSLNNPRATRRMEFYCEEAEEAKE